MVHTKYNFKWFEKEDNRKALRASISTDGKLRLGKPLCNVLPPYIRVGFDSKFKILAIADGHGTGIGRPHCGIMSAQALSAQIASTGLRFPLSFRLSRDERTGYFLGRIIPRRRLDKNSAQPQYDPEQLLILYQHLVDQMVSQLAKSTPLSERRACAAEAFYTAVQRYCPACDRPWREFEKDIGMNKIQVFKIGGNVVDNREKLEQFAPACVCEALRAKFAH